MKIISYIALTLFFVNTLSAQKIIPCATDEAIDWCKKNVNGYKEITEKKQALIEQEYQAYINKASVKKSAGLTPTYTIPVVFHILHTNGPENISDAACIAALAQVNSDFARLGADTSAINTPEFKNLYVDAKMVFQLAKKDPYGNCTTGIVHHYDTDTEWDQTDFPAFKYSNDMNGRWRPSHYLNIYVVKNIIGPSDGIIVGYTYKPGSAPGTNCDAIVYRCDFLGGLAARSLSHEIGHWFGLSHTFGDSNSANKTCGDDLISDTPKTSGFFSTCQPYASLSDSCDTGKKPNIENIMDYSSCPKMFTQGQITKMRGIAASSLANRDSLSCALNLTRVGISSPSTPCAPVADFYANKSKSCSGQSVTYNSTSFNGTISSYNWTFEGGTPATSTSSAPVVFYSAPGDYSTSLTVSNGVGTSTKVRTPFLGVNWNPGPAEYPKTEEFESGLPAGWNVQNLDYASITWQPINVGAQSTSNSFYLPNASSGGYFLRDVDILETPQYNFAATSNIAVSYYYSYAKKTGSEGFIFKFQYSTDCGGTWSDMSGTPSATAMAAVGGTVNIPFIPWDNTKWVKQNHTTTTSLNNKPNVRFRFWYQNDTKNGQSQNLYIDQFNISGVVGIQELESDIDLSIFPNPTSSSANLEFTSVFDAKASITVYDVAGRVLENYDFNTVAGLKTLYTINEKQNLSSGIYFVTLNLNNQTITKKVIID